MAIETEQLEYWGNKFTSHNLQRYMTFSAFMVAPRKHWDEIMNGQHLPLLAKQREARDRIDEVCGPLTGALNRLERTVEDLRRIDNGHPYEQLKHHQVGR